MRHLFAALDLGTDKIPSVAVPIPETARRALIRRLEAHRQQRWPELLKLYVRYRGSFAYIEGTT